MFVTRNRNDRKKGVAFVCALFSFLLFMVSFGQAHSFSYAASDAQHSAVSCSKFNASFSKKNSDVSDRQSDHSRCNQAQQCCFADFTVFDDRIDGSLKRRPFVLNKAAQQSLGSLKRELWFSSLPRAPPRA